MCKRAPHLIQHHSTLLLDLIKVGVPFFSCLAPCLIFELLILISCSFIGCPILAFVRLHPVSTCHFVPFILVSEFFGLVSFWKSEAVRCGFILCLFIAKIILCSIN